MSKVFLVGEPMALFSASTLGSIEDVKNFNRSLAGAEVNVCIGLKRLGHDVEYVTKLGKDPFAKYIIKALNNEGIGTRYITTDPAYLTGFQVKSKVNSGDPEVANFRKGSAASHLSVDEINEVDFTDIEHVHITGIFPALSVTCRQAVYRIIEKAKNNNIMITFDPNLRPSLWESNDTMVEVINDLASKCDIILPGINEGEMLMGSNDPRDIAKFYLDKGAKVVIIKVGAEGAYVATDHEEYMVPGFKVDKVVDTVGAGDGFAVGVISSILEGLTLKEAVVRGNAIGSLQVTVQGDNEGLPDREELEIFMKTKIK